MPFGYSKKIFKFPAVQYIPLKKYDSIRGDSPYQNDLNFRIFDSSQEDKLNKKLPLFGIKENYSIAENELAVLVINGYVDIVKYRGYEVFIVGYQKPGAAHLFKIVTDYYYKDRILYSFYDGESEERIDQIFINDTNY